MYVGSTVSRTIVKPVYPDRFSTTHPPGNVVAMVTVSGGEVCGFLGVP